MHFQIIYMTLYWDRNRIVKCSIGVFGINLLIGTVLLLIQLNLIRNHLRRQNIFFTKRDNTIFICKTHKCMHVYKNKSLLMYNVFTCHYCYVWQILHKYVPCISSPFYVLNYFWQSQKM